MSSLHEQLLDIERQEENSKEQFSGFKKLNHYKDFTTIVGILISYLISLAVISIIYYWNIKRDYLTASDWGSISLIAIYPTIIVASVLADMLEKTRERIPFKLAKIDKDEYDSLAQELNTLRREKLSILQQIKDEEIRAEKKIEKEKEYNFLNEITDAVPKIERRQISFQTAKQLQSELEEDFKVIKSFTTYYFHTNVYYQNRLDRISEALKNYDVPQNVKASPTSITPLEKSYDDIWKINKPVDKSTTDNSAAKIKTPKPAEIKVEPFTPTYKPVAKVEIPSKLTDEPIHKNVESIIPEPTENKIESFTPTYKPIAKIETTTNKPIEEIEKHVTTKPEEWENSEQWWKPEKKETTTPSTTTEKPIEKTETLVTTTLKKEEQPAIIKEDKSIEELFPEKINAASKQTNQKRERQPIKLDYVKINEQRKTIGLLGEQVALDYEKKRLEEKGLSKYLDDIQHVSIDDDSFGYDIKSFNEDGSERHIEVKTTTDDEKAPFYMSENEMTAMDNLNSYFIYRVYNFDITTGKGNVVPIDCDTQLEMYFDISAVSYRVSPR